MRTRTKPLHVQSSSSRMVPDEEPAVKRAADALACKNFYIGVFCGQLS